MPDESEDTAVFSGSRAPGPTQPIDIPGYRIERRLGQGGMGTVWLAEDLALGRKVAIKIVSDAIARDDESRARFLREARLLATVEHPNVVRVYSFGTVGERPYLVMEYVEGETLADRIRRNGPFALEDAVRILEQVIDALAAAWEKRVIHRDIKPSNILFDARGNLKVADFGLAKGMDAAADATLTQTGHFVGSPHYVAPEQAQGRDVDFRADIYSLGVMFFELLAGRKPFADASAMAVVAKHLQEPLPNVGAAREDVDDVIAWMTEKDPRRRPDSYAVLLLGVRRQSRRPSIQGGSWRYRTPRVLFASAAIAIILALALRPNTTTPPQTSTPTDSRIIIAVAPFYGPDAASANEGRRMATLVEREIARRMRDDAKVLGVDDTKHAVRDADGARSLGERLGASLVIWGDAFVLNDEAEIQPSITMIPRLRIGAAPAHADPVIEMASVRMTMSTANEIELRKTSAAGIGELVVFAVAGHLLHHDNAQRALELLSELKPTPDAHQQKALALLQLEREADAIAELNKALALDPSHAATRATLADIAIRARRYREAAQHFAAVKPGQHVTASEGVLFGGRLYTGETYENVNRVDRAPTMRIIDPETERVVERHWMPGVPLTFTTEEGAVVIRYASADRLAAIRYASGRFVPPRQFPDDIVSRLHSMRAGWQFARDFLGDVATTTAFNVKAPRFRYVPSATARPNGPKTHAELRAELEREIAKDPTQPWYVLHLALAQWELGDRAAAERSARQALSDAYPGVAYYEYSWMIRQLEPFGRRDWADLAYAQAKRRRAMQVQPVGASVLGDRLISAPFIRGAAALSRWQPDPPRHFEWLLRTQELNGAIYDSDAAVAKLWQRWFEKSGDAVRAKRAAAVARASKGPSILTPAVVADMNIAGADAVSIVFAVLLIVAILRARRNGVSRGMRHALVTLLVLDLALFLFAARTYRQVKAMSAIPLGASDALGAPGVIAALEQRYDEVPSSRLAYITATAQHLAGNVHRARELYAHAADDADAQSNAGDLRNRRAPRSVPSGTDVQHAFARDPLSYTFAELAGVFRNEPVENEWAVRVRRSATYFVIALAILFALCAWFAFSPPRDVAPRATLRYALAATLVLFIVLAWIGYRSGTASMDGLQTPGVVSAKFQPAYGTAWPLPPLESFENTKDLAASTSFPMRVYRGALIVAALLALALVSYERSRIKRSM